MRIPMTPEAQAKWLAECAEADKTLESEPLIIEDTDKYCFPTKTLERREQIKNSPELHEQRKQYCRDYRKKNTEKCKKGQRDWYQRNKKRVAAKKKAARLLQKSNGAVKNI